MPTVIFPNGKIVTLQANNKCGISTVTSYLTYPFFNELRGRNGKRELIEQGVWFDKETNKKSLPAADYKGAVIRDPVSRMTSIYTDRVVRKNRENCNEEITSWEIFVNELPKWQEKYKDILIHSIPQTENLHNPKYYNKIFLTGQLSYRVRKWLSKISEVEIPAHRAKDGHGESEAIKVTKKQKKLIREYYAKDYEVFGDYFQ